MQYMYDKFEWNRSYFSKLAEKKALHDSEVREALNDIITE